MMITIHDHHHHKTDKPTIVPLSWPGLKPRSRNPMFMQTVWRRGWSSLRKWMMKMMMLMMWMVMIMKTVVTGEDDGYLQIWWPSHVSISRWGRNSYKPNKWYKIWNIGNIWIECQTSDTTSTIGNIGKYDKTWSDYLNIWKPNKWKGHRISGCLSTSLSFAQDAIWKIYQAYVI